MKRFMNLLVKSGPRNLNCQDEPKIERKSQKRILGLCAAATSIKGNFATLPSDSLFAGSGVILANM